MATAKGQGVAPARPKKESAKTRPAKTKPAKTPTKKVDVEEKNPLTGESENAIHDFNEAGQPQKTERSIITMAKSDKEGFMIDEAGNRVTTASGEYIQLRKPKLYNDAGQQVDAEGNPVLDKNGNPRMKPVRDVGQKTLARALRKKIDECNQVLSAAKSKGVQFEMTYDPALDAPLVLGAMKVVEEI